MAAKPSITCKGCGMSRAHHADYMGKALCRKCYETITGATSVEPTDPSEPATSNNDELQNATKRFLEVISKRQPVLDESRIIELIRENVKELVEPTPRSIVVKTTPDPSDPGINVGIQHKLFPTLLALMSSRDSSGAHHNIWITGPAGAGKTVACLNAAKALNVGDDRIVVKGAFTDLWWLLGMRDAHGVYHRTQAREVIEHGGMLVLDELPGSDPNAVIELNSPLANRVWQFPDALIRQHPDCIVIATGNSLNGPTAQYSAVAKLDDSSKDRFVILRWDVDEELETATCANRDWVKRVQAVRKRVETKGIKVLITPRATYNGAALLSSGVDQDIVESAVLRREMTDEQWEAVR